MAGVGAEVLREAFEDVVLGVDVPEHTRKFQRGGDNTDSQRRTLTGSYTYTSSSGGSITFVQVNAATPQSSTSSVQAAYPAAEVADNLNIVVVGWNDNSFSVSSVG